MSDSNELLILLLGGRIQPAAMLAFQRHPAVVACIYSADEPQTATQIQTLLRKRFPQIQLAAPVAVSAYQPGQTRAAIEQVLVQYPAQQPVISLTGAPMPMVVGAYTIAQRGGYPAYYLNTTDGQILDLAHEDQTDAFTLRISVADYLTIHGQRIAQQQSSLSLREPYRQALTRLLTDLPTTTLLLDWLTARRTFDTPQRRVWSLADSHWHLLTQLEELGFCQRVERIQTAKTSYVRFSVAEATHRQFLTGGWLELAVLEAAQRAAIFDDCVHSLAMYSGDAQREIDFVGVRRGQGIIASCKAGQRFWNKAYLDELVAAAKALGDNYCLKLFVTHRVVPKAGHSGSEALPQFQKHAANHRIVVITGKELPQLAQIFQQEISKPTYARR